MIGVSESARALASTPGFAEWSFPAEPGAVRTARTLVRTTLEEWGLGSVTDVTVLLVSELVTNSLRYASGPIGVRMYSHAGPTLLVEVSDPLPDPPTERVAHPDDEGGRGLQLVACASRRWGTRRGNTGKTVWFELSLPG
ncbi:ATP-binding protein [Streptomyces albireticuli]|uniref:ATP-binding protein n=1 Tax=Streptomyces albireticuli TaxID=1940 RepID=UPI000D1BA480|nr:ATP-binding protein [Streptomyces albireticuli]MCD9142624.1 ATP-binding protein [Streptomyces albireticuli]MCD9164023.1 ATP-binding protein [Streptomyces albireticuli]MCD9192752.1 ATP-binding protein [Streptomyces albireticuli]